LEQDGYIEMKAIFFDLDGVLVDACDWHYYSLNDALEYYEKPKITYAEHLDRFNGLPTNKKLEILGLRGELRKDVWKMKQNRTLDNIRKYGSIDKYKIRMLYKLKEEGYKIACVTNSIKLTAIEMLSVTGLLPFMDFVITNEDVINNKPNPDCYLLAFEKMGISSSDALIIEDSPKGIMAALASEANVLKVEDIYDVTYYNIRRKINESFNTNGR